jgi:hypothetical protein
VHAALLQRCSLSQAGANVTQLPLALREAAFLETADCYTSMFSNREVRVAFWLEGGPCKEVQGICRVTYNVPAT